MLPVSLVSAFLPDKNYKKYYCNQFEIILSYWQHLQFTNRAISKLVLDMTSSVATFSTFDYPIVLHSNYSLPFAKQL
jgi:hypothetical protein